MGPRGAALGLLLLQACGPAAAEPPLRPGAAVRAARELQFEDGASVPKGALGTVTRVPGDEDGSAAEVQFADVLTDVSPGEVESVSGGEVESVSGSETHADRSAGGGGGGGGSSRASARAAEGGRSGVTVAPPLADAAFANPASPPLWYLLRDARGASLVPGAGSAGGGPRWMGYHPFGGLGNQLLNLVAAAQMALRLGRVLLIPAAYPHGRTPEAADAEHSSVAMSRLLDLGRFGQEVPNVALTHSSDALQAALARRSQQAPVPRVNTATPGRRFTSEAQPPVPWLPGAAPRWNSSTLPDAVGPADSADVLLVNCCPMYGWRGTAEEEGRVWGALRVHPRLLVTARTAARALLGGPGEYDALHVRRGDKITHKDYAAQTAVLTPATLAGELAARGIPPGAGMLYVATDERRRKWFAPLEKLGYRLAFARDLAEKHLAPILSEFPPPMWKEVLGYVEMVLCAEARLFVTSLPSTFSGAVVGMRWAAGALDAPSRPFRKLRPGCCDEATAELAPAVVRRVACTALDFPEPEPTC
eukprot:TRINITY_DN20935_c0_g1_i1.p1 TRINITY_DN20935_c0_g1~~TRINITY_DN20935_c0_g1_i1.p1  ORF type:complete len:557 (+),score=178.95 TRINITY_DN20935_c0_g1_i1:75-1673(+)